MIIHFNTTYLLFQFLFCFFFLVLISFLAFCLNFHSLLILLKRHNVSFKGYESESKSNQPIPFPMDQDNNDLIHVLNVGTKVRAYRVILQ